MMPSQQDNRTTGRFYRNQKKKKKSIKSITLGTARDSITAVRTLIK